MAAKQMEYTGTVPLAVELPATGQQVKVEKGDVVDYALWGGEQFFAGRTDFKEHTNRKSAPPKKPKGG